MAKNPESSADVYLIIDLTVRQQRSYINLHLPRPSVSSGLASHTLHIDQVRRGDSSFNKTISPTFILVTCRCHFLLACRVAKYLFLNFSRTHYLLTQLITFFLHPGLSHFSHSRPPKISLGFSFVSYSLSTSSHTYTFNFGT